MKKLLVLILVMCLLPIGVFAKQETQEDLLSVIGDIRNIQVDDDVMILETKVNDNTIEFLMKEKDQEKTVKIPYVFEDYSFLFTGGVISSSGEIMDNQYAFYLYSILESMSTAPYEEEDYYNNHQIQMKLKDLASDKVEFTNVGKTFGLRLLKEENQVRIYYQYFLDGDDTILLNSMIEARKEDILVNPATGNFNFYITTLLLIVIGLAFYTYNDSIKEK